MLALLMLLPCTLALRPSPNIVSHGRMATRLPSPTRLTASDLGRDTDLGDATTELLQCMADASNGEDIEACETAYDDVYDSEQAKADTASGEKPAMDSDDRAKLWNANGDFLDCVADASNGEDIESCEMAYDDTYTEVVGKNTEFRP